MRAALPEDDVARDNVLRGSSFGTETFAGALGGFVGAAFGGVGGGAGRLEWKEEGETAGGWAVEGKAEEG